MRNESLAVSIIKLAATRNTDSFCGQVAASAGLVQQHSAAATYISETKQLDLAPNG
jgi:hypothetical protein